MCVLKRVLLGITLFAGTMSLTYCSMSMVTMLTGLNALSSRLSTEPTAQERLHAQVLHNYDKTRVPVDRNEQKAVNVSIYMYPYDILYVRESQSSIKFCGWIDMFWYDPQLIWNPTHFANMNETFIVRSLLWLPEIDIYYRKDEPSPIGCTHCPVHVDHDGRVLRGFYFAYSYPCKIDVTRFPFDEHKCSMQIANWHMDDRYMDLYPVNETVDLSIFLPNEEWILISCKVTRTRLFYSYGHFPILTYTLHIKRKPFFYVCNLVLPSFFLTITALVGFHMSSMGSGMHQEKVKMGLTTILSIFFLQAGVSDKLPRTSDSVPLIAKFYAAMVGLLSLAIISSSFVIGIEKQGIYKRPVPAWMRVVFRVRTVITTEKCMQTQTNTLLTTAPVKSPSLTPKKCRMLDCSCRVEDSKVSCLSMDSSHKSPLLIPSSTTPRVHKASCVNHLNLNNNNHLHSNSNCKSTKIQGDGNVELREVCAFMRRVQQQIDRLNARQAREDRFSQIKTDWLLLADRVENVSLVVFVTAAFASLAWFMISGGAFDN